jgi:hypothetical protein
MLVTRAKKGCDEEDQRGTFWRGITIDSDSQLRVGRAIVKTEEQVAVSLMAQLKAHGHPNAPPPLDKRHQSAV